MWLLKNFKLPTWRTFVAHCASQLVSSNLDVPPGPAFSCRRDSFNHPESWAWELALSLSCWRHRRGLAHDLQSSLHEHSPTWAAFQVRRWELLSMGQKPGSIMTFHHSVTSAGTWRGEAGFFFRNIKSKWAWSLKKEGGLGRKFAKVACVPPWHGSHLCLRRGHRCR